MDIRPALENYLIANASLKIETLVKAPSVYIRPGYSIMVYHGTSYHKVCSSSETSGKVIADSISMLRTGKHLGWGADKSYITLFWVPDRFADMPISFPWGLSAKPFRMNGTVSGSIDLEKYIQYDGLYSDKKDVGDVSYSYLLEYSYDGGKANGLSVALRNAAVNVLNNYIATEEQAHELAEALKAGKELPVCSDIKNALSQKGMKDITVTVTDISEKIQPA